MAGNPLMNHASRFEWNGYSAQERAGADECARYLAAKACYLGYPSSRERAATSSRTELDITGASWGLAGAEAVLKPRTLTARGDFGAYWRYHLRREHERIHHARYRDSLVLAA